MAKTPRPAKPAHRRGQPVVNEGDEHDAAVAAQIRRGSALRIGLLESGYDIVASLPADMYLPERISSCSRT